MLQACLHVMLIGQHKQALHDRMAQTAFVSVTVSHVIFERSNTAGDHCLTGADLHMLVLLVSQQLLAVLAVIAVRHAYFATAFVPVGLVQRLTLL